MNHVALVGLMGAGKTTVGRRAARLLDRPFVDCDEAFIPRYGRTVADVFRIDGEDDVPAARGRGARRPARGRDAARRRDAGRRRRPGGQPVAARAQPTSSSSASTATPPSSPLGPRPRSTGPSSPATTPDRSSVASMPSATLWYRQVADEVLEVASFHEWGSSPKRAMAERIATLVAEREAAA